MNQLSNLNSVIEKTVRYDASLTPEAKKINISLNNVYTNSKIHYIIVRLDSQDSNFASNVTINLKDRGNGYIYPINKIHPFTFASVTSQVIASPINSFYPGIVSSPNSIYYTLENSVQDSENSQNIYLELSRTVGVFSVSFSLTLGISPEITYYQPFNSINQTYTQFRVLSQIGYSSNLLDQTNRLTNYINFRNNTDNVNYGFSVSARDPFFYIGFKEKTNRFFVGVSSDNTPGITYFSISYWDGTNFNSLNNNQIYDGTSNSVSPLAHNGIIITDFVDSFPASVFLNDPLLNYGTVLPYYWYKFQVGFSTSTASLLVSSIAPLLPATNEIVPDLPAPTKIYDFVGTSELYSDITFSRASLATYFESDGVLTYAPHNLLLYSQDFDQASAWTLVNDSAVALTTETAAPDGSMSAYKLYETNTTNTTRRIRQDLTRVLSQYYRFGAYLKAAERTSSVISFTQGGIAVASIEVNLITGQINPATVSSGVASYGSEPAEDGWYKVWLDSTLSTSGGTSTASIYIQSDSAYTGGVNRGIYIWGAYSQVLPSPNVYYRSLASAYYSARIAFNPTNLTPNGLQVEEQRTNIARASHDFSNANWNRVNVGVTTTALLSPSLLMNATKVECTGAAVTSALWQQRPAGSLAFSASVFVKKGNSALRANNFRLQNSTTSNNLVNFSLNYDTLDVFATVGTAGISVQKLQNGWIRLGLSTSQGINATTNNIRFYIGFNTVATNTVGDFLYAWGAQMEAGAFPTSFIPTGGADVTRSADNIGINGSNLTSWFNSTEGTFFAEAFNSFLQPSTTRRFIFNVGLSNSTTNYLAYGISTVALNSRFFEVSKDTLQVYLSATGIITNRFYEFAGSYKLNNFTAGFDGVVSSSLSGTPPTITGVGASLLFGSGFGNTSYLNGFIRRFKYWNTQLPSSFIEIYSR